MIAVITLLPVLAYLSVALFSRIQPGMRPKALLLSTAFASWISLLAALIACVFVSMKGTVKAEVLRFPPLSFNLRLDAMNVLLFMMVSIIGLVVMKYSRNYMDGDARQGAFTGRMATTLSSAYLIILSGSLTVLFISWVLTSIGLNRLLLFYPQRIGAVNTAKKKFIMARLSDAFLLLASIALLRMFGTDNLERIFVQINSIEPGSNLLALATWSLVLAALFKSAQFPTHSWLVEVMETPTPVSALLHAGLLNAGPFLIMRMAFILEANPKMQSLLLIAGGITALFGSLVYTTQSSIKTALSYSSAGHMGFSLFICGLGLYPAALVHLIAHSFYKAHAFLSSGSLIDQLRMQQTTNTLRTGKYRVILAATLVSIFMFYCLSQLWRPDMLEDKGMMILSSIIVMGVAFTLIQAWDSNGDRSYKIRAFTYALLVFSAFIILESGMHFLVEQQVPALSLSAEALWIAGLFLIAFSGIMLLQSLPGIQNTRLFKNSFVHLKNGLYITVLLDRMLGTWANKNRTKSPLTDREK
ncbi:MAG: NADH/ubiquinone/plastoquinone (complex i) [Bacteroidetes bacterium]|nr:NADH/ubiquinone/plastoquinone (complex i) [Bacteroidota bacterium]